MIGKGKARKGDNSNSSSGMLDVSVWSHFCFVCRDLNFRITGPPQSLGNSENCGTEGSLLFPSDRRLYHQRVLDLVRDENWESLHAADELVRALEERQCLKLHRVLFHQRLKS